MRDTDLFAAEEKEAFLLLARATSERDSTVCALASLLHAAAHAGVAGLTREEFLRAAAAQFERVARSLDAPRRSAA